MGLLGGRCASVLSPLRFQCSSKEKASSGNSLDADAHTRDFDLADRMEKGLSREMVADFMQPLPPARSLWKFNVERSEDRQQYRLYCDGGQFLMYARIAKDMRRVDMFMYDPLEKDTVLFDPERPSFTLVFNAARTQWRLLQERCDNCRHLPDQTACSCRCKQDVMRVYHSSTSVGDGINHCMDVHIPADWYSEAQEQNFVTTMPVWNDKVGCLVLDFVGRAIQASAKNFQLALEGDNREQVVCQYGKLGANSFGLDFKYPLTVVQAFSISLTTLFWV